MAGYFGALGVSDLRYGTTKIQEVYLGSRSLWKSLVPYEFSTTSDVNVVRFQWTLAHTHVVQGQGVANVRCSWLFDWTAIYTSKHYRTIRLLKNGDVVAEWSQGYVVRAGTWESSGTKYNLELSDGDILQMEAYADANNSNLRRLTERSIKVTPV